MLEWSEEASISRKLQVYENIHECLSFSVIAKADFCNNVLYQILTLVESFFIEIGILKAYNFAKEIKVSFMVISRRNTLQRCFETQSNI